MAERRRNQARDGRVDELVRMGWTRERARAWLASQTVDQGDEDQTADPDPDCDGGVCAADPDQPLAIWTENHHAVGVWLRVQSQWRCGPMGSMDLEGLHYGGVGQVIDRLLRKLPQDERDAVFAQVIDMEHAALEACHG